MKLKLKELKKGDKFKRKKGGFVYVKGDYVASLKGYAIHTLDDIVDADFGKKLLCGKVVSGESEVFNE